MVRKPLGRGLSALLGDKDFDRADAVTTEIDIDLIEPNPDQPRTRFGEKALEELAQSISVNGIVQPILVRKFGSRYQIVAGERRWRAAQKSGLRKVPVAIREVEDEKLLELALIENIQRQELNAIEEARAYRKLVDNIGLTQDQVAERVGKERSLVATSLRLLKLPDDIQVLIEERKLSAGHGRALLMVDDPGEQRRVAREIIDGSMSVREAERTVKKAIAAKKGKEKDTASLPKDPNVKTAETRLMRKLGTNVKIVPKASGPGGRIELEYYSSSDLDRLYQLLMKE
ncbi:MAG: ParB/RepB/Spo0J family partition protein [Blastocatellia bacterium]|nr:ParB/RepB/Spo0J family partition protein [Blastocatellia bacterium]